MIPVKLTLQGIYSYISQQTIDFTALTKEKLFGIFGNTGSGKSTILEAIILALYNYSERLGKKSFKYDMLNLKSNRLWIDFQFIADKDSNLYRITYEYIRNKKNFTDTQPTSRKLYKQNNNEWNPIELKENTIIDLIGLNSDNFERIVIIPQGRFQEFLQLEGSKRSSMMMDIFPELKEYNLFDKVKTLKYETNSEITSLQGKLSQLEDVSDEILQSKILEKETLASKNAELKINLNNINNEVTTLSNLKNQIDKKNELTTKLTFLRQKEDSINSNEKEIKEYQECIRLFKSDFDIKDNLRKSIDNKTKTLNEKRIDFEKANNSYINIAKQLLLSKSKYDSKDSCNQTINFLNKIISIKNDMTDKSKLETDLSAKNDRINNGNLYLTKHLEDINKLKNETSCSDEIMSMSTTLLNVKDWFSINSTYNTEKKNLQERLDSINKDINEKQDNYYSLLQQSSFLNILTSDNIDTIKEKICNSKIILQNKLTDINNNIERAQVKERLNEYSSQLEEGIPCPLCGNIHHPNPIHIEDVKEQLKLLHIDVNEINENIRCCDNLSSKLDSIHDDIVKMENNKKDIEKQIAEKKQQITTHRNEFHFDEFSPDDEQHATEKAKEITESAKIISKKQNKIKQLEDEAEKAKIKIASIQSEYNELNNKISILQGKIDAQRKDIPDEILNQYFYKDNNSITLEVEKIQNDITETEKEYNSLLKKDEAVKQDINTLSGAIDNIEKDLKSYQLQSETYINKITNTISTTNYFSEEYIQSILDKNLDIKKIEQEIKDFRDSEKFITSQIDAIDKQLSDKTFDEDNYKNKTELQYQIQKEYNETIAATGACEQIIKALTDKIETKKQFTKQLDCKLERMSYLEQLSSLFEGNKFVKYVSLIYLEDLCRNANKRFREMTNNQLELTINGNSEFELIDYMNDGRRRSVKTLSGGQTFQASLSLALSLVDNIRKSSMSAQNFFFIDEGFGSQDKQSLEMIFETLKSLRTENRIVGIISHVEELKERIPANITVEKTEEAGSVVRSEK